MSLLLLFGGARAPAAPTVYGTVAVAVLAPRVSLALFAPTVTLATLAPTVSIEVEPTMTIYVTQTRIRTRATFQDIAGADTNPTTVVCTVKAPDGTTSTPSVTRTATGVYVADVTLSSAGSWRIEWQGTGALVAAGDTVIEARNSWVDTA